MNQHLHRMICPCCGETKRRIKISNGDVLQAKYLSAQGLRGPSIRIVAVDKDGAVIEQVGREEIDGRFGMSYIEIVRGYERGTR